LFECIFAGRPQGEDEERDHPSGRERLFAPPFGVGHYAACAIGRVDPAAGMRPIRGYMLALVIDTVIVAAVPWISVGFLR
jgi:hypothetical protein